MQSSKTKDSLKEVREMDRTGYRQSFNALRSQRNEKEVLDEAHSWLSGEIPIVKTEPKVKMDTMDFTVQDDIPVDDATTTRGRGRGRGRGRAAAGATAASKPAGRGRAKAVAVEEAMDEDDDEISIVEEHSPKPKIVERGKCSKPRGAARGRASGRARESIASSFARQSQIQQTAPPITSTPFSTLAPGNTRKTSRGINYISDSDSN